MNNIESNNLEYLSSKFSPEEFLYGKYHNKDGFSEILTLELLNKISVYKNFSEFNIIIEIGSRDGLQALEFSDVFPKSKIFSFEPEPNNYKILVDNVNNRKNIIPLDFCISNVNKLIDFYPVINGNTGASSLLQTNKNNSRSSQWEQTKIEVKSKTMSSFLEEKLINEIDIVWADVQGAECQVFEGFGKHLKNVNFIFTEIGLTSLYKQQSKLDELLSILEDFRLIYKNDTACGTESDIILINKKFL